MTAQKKREWTVFFLIKAADETITEAIEMIDHLMGIEIPNDVAILLCVHLNKKNIEALLARDITLISKNPIQEPTTLFCEISYNTFNNIKENPDFDITDEEDLSTYFKKDILEPFRANKYFMFTWDHGNGFGIFRQPDDAAVIIEKIALRSRILTMDELADAILWAMGIKKIDLVVMMNCHMQVFDTIYAFRNNVRYIIAPQSAIPVSGYNYKAIFSKLSQAPNINASALAACVIESYGQENQSALVTNVSLSACNLKYSNLMTSLLDKLATAMALRLDADNKLEELLNAFSKAITVHGAYNLIDLYSFLYNLTKVATKDEVVWLKYIFLLKKKIVYKQHPDNAQNDYTHNGISIFSPMRISPPELHIPKLIRYFTGTAFSQDTKWGLLMTVLREIQNEKERICSPSLSH